MKTIIVLLFALSISIQLWLVFSSEYGIDSDQAITGLMAKHIMEGKIPAFFYGHSFNGSIEAMFASLYFRLFGISCQVLKLAPMTFGIIFCISMYYLGKELENKSFGLWAFLFSIMPPIYLLGHFMAPRTSYIETLVFGNMIFIFLLRSVKESKSVNVFLLGLFSGISFWNSPLGIYYILSAVIYILIRGRNIIKLKNISLGILSFIIGSLPLWIYNFLHHFASFKTGYASENIHIIKNLKTLFSYHGMVLLVSGFFNKCVPFYWAVYVVFLVCIGFFIMKNVYRYRTNHFLLVIFFVTVFVIYTRSQYAQLNTQRHLLPLYTFVPFAVSYFCRSFRYRKAGVLLFIFILAVNLSGSLLMHKEWHTGNKDNDRIFKELAEFLLANKITALYAPFWTGEKLNFISKEKLTCSEYSEEVYPRYEEVVDCADNVAFLLEGSHGIEDSLNRINAKFLSRGISGKGIFYNIEKPLTMGRALVPTKWKITSNYNRRNARAAIDRDYDRAWMQGKIKKGLSPYLEIDLGRQCHIYKIVIFNKGCLVRHLGRNIYTSKDGALWRLVSESDVVEPVFWSGPRPYYVRWFGRKEFRFVPLSARFVKIEYPAGSDVAVDEIFVYQYLGREKRDLAGYRESIICAMDFLKNKDIDFVYADFWASAKIREFSTRGIETLRQINKGDPYRKHTSRELTLDNKKAFLIDNEDVDEFENILRESGVKLKKEDCKYYSLYYPQVQARQEYVWDGLGLLKTGVIDYDIKEWRYPPDEKMIVLFKNGIEFLGCNLYLPERLLPGKYMRIDYFWKVYRQLPFNLFVFVHFIRDGKIVFQNDHPLMEQYPVIRVNPKGEILLETYSVKVPGDAKPGRYEIYMGLWIPEKQKRIHIKGPQKKITRIKIGEFLVSEFQ